MLTIQLTLMHKQRSNNPTDDDGHDSAGEMCEKFCTKCHCDGMSFVKESEALSYVMT
jgi:hypothetical protein